MQNRFNLRSVLPAMGISDAFDPTAADFTGISGTRPLVHYNQRSRPLVVRRENAASTHEA